MLRLFMAFASIIVTFMSNGQPVRAASTLRLPLEAITIAADVYFKLQDLHPEFSVTSLRLLSADNILEVSDAINPGDKLIAVLGMNIIIAFSLYIFIYF